MKLELNDVMQMKEPLQNLIAEKLPLRLAFKLNKLIKTINENVKIVEEERVKLVTSLGVKDEETGAIQVPDDKLIEFQESYLELMKETITIDITKFSLSDFENVQLSTADMHYLSFLFKE